MPSSIYQTANTLAWLKECRQHNKNAMKNTATGEWLRVACLIIEEQFSTIQGIRNEQIDHAREALHREAARLGIKGDESYIDLITGKRSVDE